MKTRSVIAAAIVAAALAGCGTAATAAHGNSNCTTLAQMATLAATYRQDMSNAQNGVPLPPGASWPQKAADLASNPQVTDAPWDQSAVNSLYWDRQFELIAQEIAVTPPVC